MTGKLILSIDPGVTTGVALLNEGGVALRTFCVKEDEWSLEAKYFRKLKPEYFVVESEPRFPDSSVQPWFSARSFIALTFNYPHVKFMSPGFWKPFIAALERPQDHQLFKTMHEHDAVMMGRCYIYWLKKRGWTW